MLKEKKRREHLQVINTLLVLYVQWTIFCYVVRVAISFAFASRWRKLQKTSIEILQFHGRVHLQIQYKQYLSMSEQLSFGKRA